MELGEGLEIIYKFDSKRRSKFIVPFLRDLPLWVKNREPGVNQNLLLGKYGPTIYYFSLIPDKERVTWGGFEELGKRYSVEPTNEGIFVAYKMDPWTKVFLRKGP